MFYRIGSTAIILCLFLAGCGKQNSDNSSLVQEITTNDLQSAQNLAKSSAVTCADASSCNPSVGMLVATRPASLLKAAAVISCTAFSVGPDLVMTNSHCVPNDLKNPLHFSSCSERLKIIFPSSGAFEGVEIKCDHIVSFSQSRAHDLPDFALIKLKNNSGRPSLKLDTNGISNNQNFDIFKVNPVAQQEPKGLLTKASCFATEGSYVLPSYSSSFAVVASLAGCDAMPGNSGSPLVNENGSVSGIFQDIVTPSQDPSVTQALNKYLADPNGSLANQIFATNLSCASLPALNFQPNPLCSSLGANAGESINLKGVETASPQELAKENNAESSFDSWSTQNNKIFRWKPHVVSETSLARRTILAPECFVKPDTWIQDYPPAWYDFLHSHASQGSIEFQGGIPEFNTQFVFNRYLQPETETTSGLSKSDIAIKFTPELMATKGQAKITILENKATILQLDISECSESTPNIN